MALEEKNVESCSGKKALAVDLLLRVVALDGIELGRYGFKAIVHFRTLLLFAHSTIARL
jgi:hypothetical protein